MTEDAPIRPLARNPRGFADKRGRDLIAERRIVARVSEVYERWGFEPLETPAFEYADALGKFLPDADRPNEGVFALQDDAGSDEPGDWMALRYDHTAPLARFAAQTWETLPKPFRRYAYGPVWRNEKPGPGRFREFWQCDADTVGSDRPQADAEIIAMACEGLGAAGLDAGQAQIRVSNRKLFDGLFDAGGVTEAGQRLTALRAIDKFDRLGWDGVVQLLGEGRLDESGDYTKGAQLPAKVTAAIEAFLASASMSGLSRADTLSAVARSGDLGAAGEAALNELAAIDRALNAMSVGQEAVKFDPTIVRGLEYYTGAVFEAELLLDTTDDKGRPVRFGSIGGGGRYDDLVARFTGQSTPATGFSFGVSRLASALRAAGRGAEGAVRGPVVVIVFSEDDMAHYLSAVAELRAAGIAAELYLGRAGMKAQMKYADRRNAPAVVILGGDEIAAGEVTIKDLDAGRAAAAGIADNEAWKAARPGQFKTPRTELVAAVRRIIE
ncbi:histidine--tRNA ligase [Brevundimonas sp. SORGH_AS_0993]|uniref:histidine--tRNA ligase n=1 Tax=Brevundimonas sp. SORGH_AS_0993 TaxID=3041794 RepID=UPI002789C91D|nr:histidine--tRNA ligase [Brevundimonas sp. SORGH_AS_0993]MDQ1154670.1 histidyl-tRNA synthetase [Brevundimonas sp. SORGH_AS_0993]